MSETFTASNGMEFTTRDGEVRWESGFPCNVVSRGLREFFRHERDEQLGRWRWPENPNYVVYLSDDGQAIVLNERTGVTVYRYRGEAAELRAMRKVTGSGDVMPATRAAEEFFATHPERKPWHDAKPGEVWHLATKGIDDAVSDSVWFVSHSPQQGSIFRPTVACTVDFIGVKATAIVSARRIWPEGE